MFIQALERTIYTAVALKVSNVGRFATLLKDGASADHG